MSVLYAGSMEIGELLATVGVSEGSVITLWSMISLWKHAGNESDMSWWTCLVSDDVIKIATRHVDAVCTHRMSDDRQTCVVHLPCELRHE